MKKLNLQPVANILKNKNLFTNSVTEHVLMLQQLTKILQSILPEPLAKHCQVANIHSDLIVLTASSPAWSSRLRFHTPVILKTLQQVYNISVHNTRILVSHVEPDSPGETFSTAKNTRDTQAQTSAPQTLLSQMSAKLVRETAQNIKSADLRDSLMRLSAHSEKLKP
jgi:hypothetical protein